MATFTTAGPGPNPNKLRLAGTGVGALRDQLGRFRQELRQRDGEVVRRAWGTAVRNIIVGGTYAPGTPIRTGWARNSWVLGLNQDPAFRQPARHPTPDTPIQVVSLNEALRLIDGMKAGDYAILKSNAAHIRRLEFGWSQQAPTGMVRLTLAAGQRIVDEAVREVRAERSARAQRGWATRRANAATTGGA